MRTINNCIGAKILGCVSLQQTAFINIPKLLFLNEPAVVKKILILIHLATISTSEYGIGNEVSTYGDIFSYGILLLELFTAKRPTDSTFEEGFSLHQYVEMALPQKITEVIDQSLFLGEHSGAYKPDKSDMEMDIACITSVLTVGIQCSKEEPAERMQITDALKELHRIREKLNGTL